jgi:hypothetical protein
MARGRAGGGKWTRGAGRLTPRRFRARRTSRTLRPARPVALTGRVVGRFSRRHRRRHGAIGARHSACGMDDVARFFLRYVRVQTLTWIHFHGGIERPGASLVPYRTAGALDRGPMSFRRRLDAALTDIRLDARAPRLGLVRGPAWTTVDDGVRAAFEAFVTRSRRGGRYCAPTVLTHLGLPTDGMDGTAHQITSD